MWFWARKKVETTKLAWGLKYLIYLKDYSFIRVVTPVIVMPDAQSRWAAN